MQIKSLSGRPRKRGPPSFLSFCSLPLRLGKSEVDPFFASSPGVDSSSRKERGKEKEGRRVWKVGLERGRRVENANVSSANEKTAASSSHTLPKSLRADKRANGVSLFYLSLPLFFERRRRRRGTLLFLPRKKNLGWYTQYVHAGYTTFPQKRILRVCRGIKEKESRPRSNEGY